MSTKRCTWGRGWLTPEHLRDCKDAACEGCRGCPRDHCAMRGKCASHVDRAAGLWTCPGCIGKVRADLRAVEQLYAVALPAEAAVKGVESEAFNLAGPGPAPDALAERREADEWMRGWCAVRPAPDLEPYTLLGKWDLALRESYGPPTRLRITVARAADYLTGLLAGPFPHGDEFAPFAAEVHACREHLEEVIHDSHKPEEGARCPTCGKGGPRLRKRYAEGSDEKTRHGERDTWHCPADAAHWWTERDYRNRVNAVYVEHAEHLTASQIEDQYGITAGALRKRAERDPKIRRGRNSDGRMLYDVKRALASGEGEKVLA